MSAVRNAKKTWHPGGGHPVSSSPPCLSPPPAGPYSRRFPSTPAPTARIEFTVFALERRAAGLDRPWPGVVAVALTSAAGFAVLGFSRLAVLREFGLVVAGSVLLALAAARLVVGSARSPASELAADGTVVPAEVPA
jgi:hypothetical protein